MDVWDIAFDRGGAFAFLISAVTTLILGLVGYWSIAPVILGAVSVILFMRSR